MASHPSEPVYPVEPPDLTKGEASIPSPHLDVIPYITFSLNLGINVCLAACASASYRRHWITGVYHEPDPLPASRAGPDARGCPVRALRQLLATHHHHARQQLEQTLAARGPGRAEGGDPEGRGAKTRRLAWWFERTCSRREQEQRFGGGFGGARSLRHGSLWIFLLDVLGEEEACATACCLQPSLFFSRVA